MSVYALCKGCYGICNQKISVHGFLEYLSGLSQSMAILEYLSRISQSIAIMEYLSRLSQFID